MFCIAYFDSNQIRLDQITSDQMNENMIRLDYNNLMIDNKWQLNGAVSKLKLLFKWR